MLQKRSGTMRIARRIVAALGILVIALVLGVAVLFAAIQSAPGKRMLAAFASRMASQDGLTVAIEDISGFVPSDMRIGRITLSDATGPFGTVDGLALAWHPLALLSGTVNVSALTADRVAIDRRPVLPASTATSSSSSSGGLPMIRIVLGKLEIADIEIGEAVAGMAAQLGLTASARLVDPAEGLALDFQLTRRDAPGELKGRARYAPDGGRDVLDLDVTASEPEGGLVARLAGIEGLPALALTVKGSAPLDDWNGTLAFDAGAAGRIDGTGAVRVVDTGRRIMLDVKGDVAGLLPASVRPLFAGETTLTGSAVATTAGPVQIEGLNASATGFGLALVGTLDPAAKTADLSFDLVGGQAETYAAFVPGIAWKDWRLHAKVNGALARPNVDAEVTATGLGAHGYGSDRLDLALTTEATGSDLAFKLVGSAEGLTAAEPKVSTALGKTATFAIKGALGDAGPNVTDATIRLTPLDLAFSGAAGPSGAKGALHLTRLDLAAFSALANRPLSGTIALDGTIDTGDKFSAIALDLNGSAHDVATGIALADSFLKGETRIAGGVSRSADGAIRVSDLKLAADGLSLRVDGAIEQQTADLAASLKLNDLTRLDPRISGAANADLRFSGGFDALGLKGTVDIPSAVAMDKPIEALRLSVDLADLTHAPAGTIALDGRIAGKPAKGSARFTTETAGQRVDDLDFAIGGVRATGNVALAGGLAKGRLQIAASDLSDLSPLILTQIAGRLDATVVLDTPNNVQRVAVNGTARSLAFAGNRLDQADIDLTVADPANAPVLNGRATLSGLVTGSQRIEKATLTAKSAGSATDITLDTAFLGASIAARANVAPAAGSTRIRLDQLRLAKGPATVTLSQPANITLANGGVAIDRLVLATGGGGATISGKAGAGALDLTADIRNLPLALAAIASPTLDLRGTLSGNARITGTPASPSGNYDIRVAGLTMPEIQRQGAGPFDITAKGTLGGGRVNVDAAINGRNISGLTIRGSAPIGAGNLDLRIAGAIDLAIANTALATSGSTVRGKATVDAALRGTAAAPSASGTVRVSGATFTDSVNGVTLTGIEAVLTGTDRAIEVTRLTAQTPQGGSLSGSGRIGLDAAAGFPASIEIRLTRAEILSSALIRLVSDGRITVEGPVATRPKIGGRLDIRRLDINIADRMPGGLDPLQVRHINTGGQKTVADTSLRAKANARAASANARRAKPQPAFVADLDLTMAAPNGVFVRGMGIEAEFGGDLTIRGTTASPTTLGAFNLRRGRFDILGRRLDFTEGTVGFNGSTDPTIDFTASTTTSDVTASVIVSGTASAPEISFTSSPTLAQDEVLSRILFGKSISTLNASQALQVAQAIAQFSGGGPGVLDNVRRSLGVDSLDVDATGQVGIGKRLNDRVYVGARQGPTASSGKVTVDVDVTRNIRLQGAAGADGAGELGVGAQWDY
ncbi:translocation and assembly module TamB [Kaistia hirudinis]|uniref:Translocation and assembly module TamB n=1 Tax=Kaistia hirudinis TaxID=1293440 RepID=A0A840AJC2_9HYPH|nr:translocation/assembly module TamB domain-containing protein [Kaistia hirudinis]MBB3930310.1 translocation and assembly module TamB [Kaistia hirudinis]